MFPETYWTSHPADAQERLKISHGSLDPVLSGKTGSFIGFAGRQVFDHGKKICTVQTYVKKYIIKEKAL